MEKIESAVSARMVAAKTHRIVEGLALAEEDLELLLRQRRGPFRSHDPREAVRLFNAFARLQGDLLLLSRDITLSSGDSPTLGIVTYAGLVRSERAAGFAVPAVFAAFVNPELLWFKICWVLGIDEVVPAIREFFTERYQWLIDEIEDAFKKRNWRRLRTLLKRLLGILMTDEFAEWLINKLGKKHAERILKKLSLRLIPGLGWLVTAGMIIAAILAQFIIE
jgi:hypothetical protein